MKHANTNTTNDARDVSIYTHDGKHLHGRVFCAGLNYFKRGEEERFAAVRYALSLGSIEQLSRHANFNAIADATGDAFGTWRGVRPIKRTRDGERAGRPHLLDATGAALAAASLTIRNAYRDAGMNARTLTTISAALENGDAATYRKLTATAYTAASAENGLHMIGAAIARAYGVTQRTAGHVDAATRTRLMYDALMTDTSGAALDMLGDAYAAIIAERGHAGAALFYGAAFRAGRAAARRVLYAARVKQTRTAASVEEWRAGECVGVAPVPTAWDVYTYEDMDYLRAERDALAAACTNRYAARFITYRLQGLTAVEIAARLRVTVRTVERVAAAVRETYNRTHGTAYGAAHARARE